MDTNEKYLVLQGPGQNEQAGFSQLNGTVTLNLPEQKNERKVCYKMKNCYYFLYLNFKATYFMLCDSRLTLKTRFQNWLIYLQAQIQVVFHFSQEMRTMQLMQLCNCKSQF